jgi:hypothetical protein
MYVLRLRSIDSGFNFRAFTSRRLALSNFEAGQDQVIDERLEESALFEVASTEAPTIAIQRVKDGKAPLVQIYPRPMTEAQAAAWLADLNL